DVHTSSQRPLSSKFSWPPVDTSSSSMRASSSAVAKRRSLHRTANIRLNSSDSKSMSVSPTASMTLSNNPSRTMEMSGHADPTSASAHDERWYERVVRPYSSRRSS